MKRRDRRPQESKTKMRFEAMALVAFVAAAGSGIYCVICPLDPLLVVPITTVIGAALGYWFGPLAGYLFIP